MVEYDCFVYGPTTVGMCGVSLRSSCSVLIADHSLCANVLREYEAPDTKGLRQNRWRHEGLLAAYRQVHFQEHFQRSNWRATPINISITT